ncbi:hypothetical protein CHUAL_011486 [Chamberlinius hualienensis]
MSLPVLHIVPGRIQSKRLQILQSNARKNNYVIADTFYKQVTHILTEFDNIEQVLRALKLSSEPENVLILRVQWLIDSIKQGSPIEQIENVRTYFIPSENPTETTEEVKTTKFDSDSFPAYVCQRKCVLNHKNSRLVDALSVLAGQAELRDENDYSRALAFYRAISTLKCIDFEVNSVDQVEKLPDIGPHCLRVIKELLEDGHCAETQQILSSEWFKSMKAFNAIYGIGTVTAKKLYALGMRTIQDLRENTAISVKSDDRVAFGLAFYEDLNETVSMAEAQSMKTIISSAVSEINPEFQLELTGGFRRGKPSGHDVDFMLWHPEEDKEVGFLNKLLARLSEQSLILHSTYRPRTDETKADKSTLDHFEQALLILKLPISTEGNISGFHPKAFTYEALRRLAENRSRREVWKAIRVDLVVCPVTQLAFALLGWTGNKWFNRSIRDYAKKQQNKRLTSHGLWDFNSRKHIWATTEQEIFEILQLNYLEPWERNA